MISSLLCPDAFISPLAIDAAVMRALEEDLGRAGDVTSIATIPEGTQGRAWIVARQSGVVAGCRSPKRRSASLRPISKSPLTCATASKSRPRPP